MQMQQLNQVCANMIKQKKYKYLIKKLEKLDNLSKK